MTLSSSLKVQGTADAVRRSTEEGAVTKVLARDEDDRSVSNVLSANACRRRCERLQRRRDRTRYLPRGWRAIGASHRSGRRALGDEHDAVD